MDEFRYGDWLLVLGGAWFCLRFLATAISVILSPRGYVHQAPKDTSSSAGNSEQ